jgi:hypothetical protein
MINTVNQLLDALANNNSRFVVDKSSIASMVAGQLCSLWRATGSPGQGAIPTAAAIPTSALVGSIPFTNQIAPNTSYLGWLSVTPGNSACSLEVHDRVAHLGGLVLNVTTPQTITGLDLGSGGLNLGAARRGAANFSEINWYLEVYTDGGATASNATINVTYHDNTSGNLNVVAVGGTLRVGRMIALNAFIPTPGLYIRAINSVTLSASTTVAGNFGFTATRVRSSIGLELVNMAKAQDWAQLGLPEIPNDSCLQFVILCGTTASGVLRGVGKMAHG